MNVTRYSKCSQCGAEIGDTPGSLHNLKTHILSHKNPYKKRSKPEEKMRQKIQRFSDRICSDKQMSISEIIKSFKYMNGKSK